MWTLHEKKLLKMCFVMPLRFQDLFSLWSGCVNNQINMTTIFICLVKQT